MKLLVKTYFNAVRCFSAGLLFDFIIVANKRQLDLHRGMMFPFQLTRDFSRVSVIPFGCEESRNCSRADGRRLMSELGGVKLGDDDFLVGWLGGTYGWFDLELPLRAASEAICRNSQIKLIFFGVDKAYREELLEYVAPAARDNIIFLPWVDFSRRFQYWSGFDLSLVWGGGGYENDYASRTRNFDCLTLSLPIIQNYDDEWGERLRASGGGVIADQSSLAEGIYRLSKDQGTLAAMRKSMAELAGGFYWRKFTDSLLQQVAQPAMSLGRRMVGFFAMLAVLPAVFVFFVFSSLTIFLERWFSNNEA
ncbi:hypothetical protein IB232_05030 [Pseudomonas sp. PDM15]|nr:hypothetical protein [Pseudomonas sp. PDM15]